MSLAMTRQAREAFLAEVHVGIISIADEGRGPLTVPIWYTYEPGGELRIVTARASRKGRLLARAGRFSLCAQTETPPYRYVSVEGPVVLDDSPRDHLEMAIRYLGPALGRSYIDRNPSGEDAIVVRLVPERWRTKDYGKLFPGGTDAS